MLDFKWLVFRLAVYLFIHPYMGCVVCVTGRVDPFPGNHTLCLCHSQRHSTLRVDTYSHSCGTLVLTSWEEMDGSIMCVGL